MPSEHLGASCHGSRRVYPTGVIPPRFAQAERRSHAYRILGPRGAIGGEGGITRRCASRPFGAALRVMTPCRDGCLLNTSARAVTGADGCTLRALSHPPLYGSRSAVACLSDLGLRGAIWRRGWDYSARSASPLRGRPPGADAMRDGCLLNTSARAVTGTGWCTLRALSHPALWRDL
jgi:hypothetical protein